MVDGEKGLEVVRYFLGKSNKKSTQVLECYLVSTDFLLKTAHAFLTKMDFTASEYCHVHYVCTNISNIIKEYHKSSQI